MLARKSFSTVPTFVESTLLPTFIAADQESDNLAGGFIWTLYYAEGDDEIRAATFGLSPGELREVIRDAEAALSKLSRLAPPTHHKED
jgi:hypothetical protein